MSDQATSAVERSPHDRRRQLEALLRKKSEKARSFPLSFAQQRLWILDRLDPGNAAYNIPLVMRLRGPLDLNALNRSLTEMVARHESLRTKIVTTGDKPRQVVEPATPQSLTVVDLEHVAPSDREAEAVVRAQAEARQPFRLDQAPLFRALLLRFSSTEHVVVVVMHHIISDGWSMGVLFHELAVLYQAFAAGRPSPLKNLAIQYADYAVWQRGRLKGETLQGLLDYWGRRLEDVPPLSLPTDQPHALDQRLDGATETMRLPSALAVRLRESARGEGATFYMILLAAFEVLLYRYSGQEDFAVGSPIAGRTRRETEGLVGFFVNTLALRANLAGNPTFRQFLAQVRQSALEAFRHQELPFEQLVDALNPARDSGRHPLFQVMFALQNAPRPEVQLAGISFALLPIDTGTAMFELSFNVQEQREGLFVSAEYSSALFQRGTIERMLRHFQVLLEGIVADADLPVAQLPLLTEDERHQLLVEFNETARDYPTGLCVHEWFERQAEQSPDALALIDGPRQWSYRELSERANRLAHYLQRRGVGPNHLVAIRMNRSAELIVGLWGILKAGGAYLPLDPDLPAERLKFTLEDAQVEILVTQHSLREDLPEGLRHVVCMDTDWQEIAGCPGEPPTRETAGDHLAYVIYTSGSTGRPKGVMIEHRTLMNYTQAAIEQYGITAADRVLQFAAASFDAHVEEVFPCLSCGGTLVLRNDEMLDCKTFLERCQQWQLTFVTLPTAFWHELTRAIAAEGLAVPATLRLLVIGGEQAAPERVATWFQCVGSRVRLMNTYGPTETTVVATAAELGPADGRAMRVSIGHPLGNYRAYVLDDHRQPTAVGVPGELYLGGESLARGYLNRPELTEERFLPDPFATRAGARMYKTGDVVRWRSDGRLEFVGRTDHQVKIRGFRIEPGEVEQVLREHPALADAAVAVRERTSNDLQLVAYTVVGQGQTALPADLRRFLRERLPEFMIPAAFVALEWLPLTASGKVDRRALPDPDWSGDGVAREGDFVAPRTPTEEQLAALWSEVLNVARVGTRDNFFDLGGNSLLALRVASRVRQVFSVDLPPIALFTARTVAALAEQIVALQASPRSADMPRIERVLRDGPLPASFAQEPFWFLQQFSPGSNDLNMHAPLSFTGPLNSDVLRDTINEVIRRHEALRTRFALTDTGALVQVLEPELRLDLPVEDLSHLPEPERARQVAWLSQQQAATPFDLGREPLMRLRLLRLGERQHTLLVTTHHVICDGWSLDVLSREVAQIYGALLAGRPSPLAELPVQYADYSVWQRNYLRGESLESLLGYWRKKLDGLTALELPTDRPRQLLAEYRKQRFTFRIPNRVKIGLGHLCSEQGVTPYMATLAAFQVLLHRYSDSDDIAVGSMSANRVQAETQDMIGLFINTLVMRNDLSGDPSFRALLARVAQTAIEAYDHQELRFELLVKELQPDRDLTKHPLIRLWFAFHQFSASREFEISPGLAIEGPAANGAWEAGEDFDLTLGIEDEAQGFNCQFGYDVNLFDEETIARMATHFQTLLEAIIADPDARISQLPLLAEREREQVLVEWNRTQVDFGLPGCVHQLFERQVERAPESTALAFEGQTMTYRELNARANQLAHYLVRQGVGPEVSVGICLQPSLDLAVAILGTLKAGGFYVPLDPEDPRERLDFFAADSHAAVILSLSSLADRCPAGEAPLVFLDAERETIARESESAPATRVTPENAVCLLYTSGSTGTPKGVVNLHRGVSNYLLAKEQMVGLGPDDRILFTTPISFDTSVEEFFFALTCGGCLVIERAGGNRRDMSELVQLIAREQITTACFVPSTLRLLLEEEHVGTCHSLKRVFVGGETLTIDLVERFFRCLNAELYNEYGPTEASIDVAVWKCRLDYLRGIIPIGGPIANVRLYVLDAERNPVPIGVPGELYIGGVAVARGYLNRPELNAERFLADPFSGAAGDTMYRTGDRCRWLPDGNIEFLGRRDGQVKIHGGRLELGEVEAAISRHPAVAQAAVVVRQSSSDYKYLAAYVVPRGGPPDDADARAEFVKDVRQYLRSSLPEYMIPQAFEILDILPKLSSGKVNRAALPDVAVSARPAHRYVAPRTDTERQLAAIWADVLQLERAGAHDNFFDLGGHSLLAVRLTSRIRSEFSIDMPLITLFSSPTLEELAEKIETLRASGHTVDLPAIQPAPRDVPLPMSYGQEALWVISQLEEGLSPYVTFPAARVRGDLDLSALERAVNEVLRRHESLRTTFAEVEGRPVQVIAPYASQPLPVVDLSGLPAEGREEEARRYGESLSQRPMDLSKGPLAWVEVLTLSADEHVVLIGMHHIIYDGWSMAVLEGELLTAYRAFAAGLPSPLPELPIQYADFAVWQRQRLQGEVLDGLRHYWLKQLEGLPALELPADKPRPKARTARGASRRCQLPLALSEAIAQLSRREGATTFMTLLAGFQTLLHRYSGQDDFPIGTPVAGRLRPETENLIGYFVNTLVLRADLSGDPPFRELLGRTRQTALEAFDHQELPFERLVQDLNPPRDPSRHPVFQVMLVLHNTPQDLQPSQESPELELSGLESEFGQLAGDFDLVMICRENEQGIDVSLHYRTDLFDEETIARMLQHFQTLLEAAVADPDQPISRFSMLGESERRQLLVEWNQTEADYPKDVCLHNLFELQVARAPEAVAVVFEDQSTTYGQLNAQANQLARYLQGIGVGADMPVGVCLERGTDLVVGILGVLKAGAAYVPLDPRYPRERLAMMLGDCRAPVLVTTAALRSALSYRDARTVCLDTEREQIACQDPTAPPCAAAADNLAYVIYTSGSTGTPKGVMVSHRNVVHSTAARLAYYGEAPARFLFVSSIAFDSSVAVLFWTLCQGGTLVVPCDEAQQDLGRLGELVRQHQVTHWLSVRSAYAELLNVAGGRDLASLRVVIVGGEACPAELYRRHRQLVPGAEFYNEYGPTEGTVWSTVYRATDRDLAAAASVPIGRPIRNMQVYVLDENLAPAPVGVPGELCVAGGGVAMGYLHRPELTQRQFVPNPFGNDPQQRMYKTGDLVKWLANGNLAFLGRIDAQVKIRGFRIELGEIESALRRRADVRDAVVAACDGLAGGKQLVAYVVAEGEALPASAELRRFLSASLPDYMIPAAFVPLEAIPLNPNGKVNYKALPPPEREANAEVEYVAPRTDIERQLAEIWQDVLELERVGIHDNFFSLGGHSLLAVRVMVRARAALAMNLSVATLFAAPTIAELANRCEAAQSGDSETDAADAGFIQEMAAGLLRPPAKGGQSLVPLRTDGAATPLFCIHGLGGHVASFLPLANGLADARPVYGLQAQGLDRGQQPHDRIEAMADFYLQEIRQAQPHGPYLLAGWSMGGLIALEAAKRLQADGEEVALLAMLDSYLSAEELSSEDLSDNSLIHWLAPYLNLPLAELTKLPLNEQWQRIAERANLSDDIGVAEICRLAEVCKAHLAALEAYVPRPYHGPVVLLSTEDGDGPDPRWKALCPQLCVETVPGNHYSMLRKPHADVLGNHLDVYLQEALAGGRLARNP